MTTPATIVDSHCHLDFPDFAEELPDVVARAVDAGVERMVTICTKLPNEPAVRAIAEAHAPVYFAAGVLFLTITILSGLIFNRLEHRYSRGRA